MNFEEEITNLRKEAIRGKEPDGLDINILYKPNRTYSEDTAIKEFLRKRKKENAPIKETKIEKYKKALEEKKSLLEKQLKSPLSIGMRAMITEKITETNMELKEIELGLTPYKFTKNEKNKEKFKKPERIYNTPEKRALATALRSIKETGEIGKKYLPPIIQKGITEIKENKKYQDEIKRKIKLIGLRQRRKELEQKREREAYSGRKRGYQSPWDESEYGSPEILIMPGEKPTKEQIKIMNEKTAREIREKYRGKDPYNETIAFPWAGRKETKTTITPKQKNKTDTSILEIANAMEEEKEREKQEKLDEEKEQKYSEMHKNLWHMTKNKTPKKTKEGKMIEKAWKKENKKFQKEKAKREPQEKKSNFDLMGFLNKIKY